MATEQSTATAPEREPALALPPRVSVLPVDWTLADLQAHLGGIPLDRIPVVPPPGTATEEDVVQAESRIGRICELVDGTLVAKTMGWYESALAAALIGYLRDFVAKRRLGVVTAPDGTARILPGQVRAPDVAFIRWERLPKQRTPKEPIPALVPDLAIEILSKGNTPREMKRKLQEYFQAGVMLVWYIEPKKRIVEVYTSPEQMAVVREDEMLTGGDVLPGFELRLGELYAAVEPPQ